MKTRCPCCGAENSLDALLAHDEAREAVWAVAQVGGELGRLAAHQPQLAQMRQLSADAAAQGGDR